MQAAGFFPIFANLHNRKVLLLGAGQVAERKAEALLQAGARLEVVAKRLSERFRLWQEEGLIHYLAEDFALDFLEGAFLVVLATEDSALNREVFLACEARAILCNSVDNPENCSFITSSVVDRGSFKIAISSGGKAPVLARFWHKKLEREVPLYSADLADLAGDLRPLVKSRLLDMEKRRIFWERFFEDTLLLHALSSGDMAQAKARALVLLDKEAACEKKGEVVLVGAGTGDAGLLTLHALQALHEADVVFYDALVSDAVLKRVRKDAEKVCVGKRASCHFVSQDKTNRLLIEQAKRGRRVVRLKGGDPFVFGRGGEECEALREASVPYRVIPGISAGIAAGAYAGIPLTHRDYAQSVLFVAGHSCSEENAPDWRTMALAQQTLVIYMGKMRASEIAQALLVHGRAPDTPVAVISNASLPQQEVRIGVLSELADLAEEAPMPALIVIGEVVALQKRLNWYKGALCVECEAAQFKEALFSG